MELDPEKLAFKSKAEEFKKGIDELQEKTGLLMAPIIVYSPQGIMPDIRLIPKDANTPTDN